MFGKCVGLTSAIGFCYLHLLGSQMKREVILLEVFGKLPDTLEVEGGKNS